MTASVGQIAAFEAQFEDQPDFKIQIEDYEWLVHSKVLSKSSKFFEKAFNGSFKESDDKVVKLHDDCPWIVALMLLCFYRKNEQTLSDLLLKSYQPDLLEKMMLQGAKLPNFAESRQRHLKHSDLVIQTRLLRVADKYEIQNLKETAKTKVLNGVRTEPESAKSMVQILGTVVIENDRELLGLIMNGTFETCTSTAAFRTKIRELVSGDVAIMRRATSYLLFKLDIFWANNRSMRTAMTTAQETLVEAESRMTYHPNNNPAKEKIREAAKMLNEACDKLSKL